MDDAQPRLAVINGLRAVAIIGVVWHHAVYKLWLRHASEQPWEPIAALLNSGWLGVNLFFVLSGFVLYLPYAAGRRDADSKSEWMDFYKRRAVRLLPLFYLSLCGFALVDILSGRPALDTRQTVTSLTITFNFFTNTFFPKSNWVLWSLGVEIWFSALFPVVVLAARRYGIGRVLVTVLILGLLFRVVGTRPEIFLTGDRLNPLKDGIAGRLDDFVVGMWLCHAFVHGHLERPHVRKLAAAAAAAGFLSCMLWERVISGNAPNLLVPFLHNGVQLGCAAALVFALTAPARWAVVLTNRPVQLIGMMCFSIYVWHGRPIELLLGPQFDPLAFGMYLALVAGIGTLSYRFIEFPRVRPWQRLFAPALVADHRR